MIDNHYYVPSSPVWTLYNMGSPEHVSVHVLPPEYKQQVIQQLELTIKYMEDLGFSPGHTQQIKNCIPWVLSKDTWEEQKKDFKEEIHRLDSLRGEDFTQTFPELASLYKPPAKLRP